MTVLFIRESSSMPHDIIFDMLDMTTLKKCMQVSKEFYQYAGRALMKPIVKFIMTEFSLLTEPTFDVAKHYYSQIIKTEDQLLSLIKNFIKYSEFGVINHITITSSLKTPQTSFMFKFIYGESNGKHRSEISAQLSNNFFETLGTLIKSPKSGECLINVTTRKIERLFNPDYFYTFEIPLGNQTLQTKIEKIISERVKEMDKEHSIF